MNSNTVTFIPALRKDEKYHVFISYSNGDSIWVSGLIHKLESALPGLKICFHERDFVPGKTIIDNMVECIQSSQKIVLVLSPEFVRSRWCLFEANLSMFQDCMLQKGIVPIMLKPCPIPLNISHLTYLEADDEQFFRKLCNVLLSNNSQLTHSNLIHYQPSFLYNGKNLHTLLALNDNGESWQPGFFSSSVPDSLRVVFDDVSIFKEAVEMINATTPCKSILRLKAVQAVLGVFLILLSVSSFAFCVFYFLDSRFSFNLLSFLPVLLAGLLLMPTLFVKLARWKLRQGKLIIREMVKNTGQANLILSKNSVLAGCLSRVQLYFVYVSVYQCMETFYTTFGHNSKLATNMWEKAIIIYSSDYACCLARKHFPFNCLDFPRHMEDGICFCQYVSAQLNMETFQL